jgi:Ser/Thr protein kinase RdoA (MazF antagonist)
MEHITSGVTGGEIHGVDRIGVAPAPDADLLTIAYSILSADALQAEVAQAYAIDTPVSCQLLLPSMNDTYLLTTRDCRYILRVYRARWRSLSEILYELELLGHLAAQGVSVSLPLFARDGGLVRPLPAPEGTRYLVLFTYAEGVHLPLTEEANSYRVGQVAAAIHTASEDFTSRHRRSPLDLECLIDAPLAALRPFFAHRPDDWSYLERFAARLRVRAGAVVQPNLDWGICHGDLGGGNIHVTEDQKVTVFDFDLCGPGWRAWDLTAIQQVATEQNQAGIWDSFVKGYTETRPLAAADLTVVPLFGAIRHLWSLGLQASNVADWGILRVSDWILDRELTFFRAWEAEHMEGERRVTNGG